MIIGPKFSGFSIFGTFPEAKNIITAIDGQPEMHGTTFASSNTFKTLEEHHEFSNLVTLKTAKVRGFYPLINPFRPGVLDPGN